MESQKVCKQGRDDIIVKVSLQSPIPTSFYIIVANLCENNNYRDEAFYYIFMFTEAVQKLYIGCTEAVLRLY